MASGTALREALWHRDRGSVGHTLVTFQQQPWQMPDLVDKIPGEGQNSRQLARAARERYSDLTPFELELLADALHEKGYEVLGEKGGQEFQSVGDAMKHMGGKLLDKAPLCPHSRALTLGSICDEMARAKRKGYDFAQCISPTFQRRRQIAQRVIGNLPDGQRQVTRVYEEVADKDNEKPDTVRTMFNRAMGGARGDTREEKWNELQDLLRYGSKLHWLTDPH